MAHFLAPAGIPVTPRKSPLSAERGDIPRLTYGLIVATATAGAIGLAWWVATWLGGTGSTVRVLLLALGAGSFATLVPAVVRMGREHWGLAVVASGVGRALIVLGICYGVGARGVEVSSRPMFVGAAAALGLMLVVETVASIVVLSRVERARAGARAEENGVHAA